MVASDNSNDFFNWVRVTTTYEEDYKRLKERFKKEIASGKYNRLNALRTTSRSITSAYAELVDYKDPDFIEFFKPTDFNAATKKSLAERFLSRIEHEIGWDMGKQDWEYMLRAQDPNQQLGSTQDYKSGKFKPLPIEEILSDKKFQSAEEMDEWVDRLSHTKNVHNILSCQKYEMKDGRVSYSCKGDIPAASKKAIADFKETHKAQIALGQQIAEKRGGFGYVNKYDDDYVCFFEPNISMPNIVVGLCVKPRAKTKYNDPVTSEEKVRIEPPRAEIATFLRQYDPADLTSSFVKMGVPLEQGTRKHATRAESIVYSNEKNKKGIPNHVLFQMDEGEYLTDLTDLITRFEIRDVRARESEREKSRLSGRRDLRPNDAEFWQNPVED